MRIAGLALVLVTLAGPALGQGPPSEAARHLGALEVYRAEVTKNALVLIRVPGLGPEVLGNLERALSGFSRHLNELGELSQARRIDPRLFVAVERDLHHARDQVDLLREAVAAHDNDRIRTLAAGVVEAMRPAGDDLAQLGAAFERRPQPVDDLDIGASEQPLPRY